MFGSVVLAEGANGFVGHSALIIGFEIAVPLFVESGDKIEIDTRTHEYRKRV